MHLFAPSSDEGLYCVDAPGRQGITARGDHYSIHSAVEQINIFLLKKKTKNLVRSF